MGINPEIKAFNEALPENDHKICERLSEIINSELKDAEQKIWHRHPVWFLNENPIVGYSKQKAGIRLMFWSGDDFEEEKLKAGTGKFKDASIFYNSIEEIDKLELKRWLEKARLIQWDYKNIYKRKGELKKIQP